MNQTTRTDSIFIPDGCMFSVKAHGESSYSDLGVVMGDVTNTLEYTENEVLSGNAGEIVTSIKDMKMTGGLTLGTLAIENIERFSGGIFTKVVTDGTPVATIPDQVIPSGWEDNKKYDINMFVSSTDQTKIRTTLKPVITSVELDPDGTPETLTENSEYVITSDSLSDSGWAIQFISANIIKLLPKTFDIKIVYGTNTPVAKKTLHCGTTSQKLTAASVKFTHTDENGKKRELELHSVKANSGSFAFNFKGANSDGIEEMPLTYTARLDKTRIDKQQLASFSIDEGAA